MSFFEENKTLMGSRSVYCNKNVMAMLMKADRSIEREKEKEKDR